MKTTPAPRTAHLVCNAHLDPVWQWEWQEGAAEAVSTFRVAAEFCEQFDGFIFNHNEAVLYQWVELHDPALFRKILKLVRAGKWHVAGGWFLQPDCNMPSGESIIRQITTGLRYFKERFGVRPTTAYNFDSFGHSRGLVQILRKAGYDSYIHCRPSPTEWLTPLPANNYRWIGYDGSEIIAHHTYGWYGTAAGEATQRIDNLLKERASDPVPALLILWGIGDHGGGPSRKDLQGIEALRRRRKDVRIVHSTPEQFFRSIRSARHTLPAYPHALQRSFPGCYTSQVRLKQEHRRLESLYFSTERLVTHAWANGLMPYPAAELEAALRPLLFNQFHDILCGTCVPAGEATALRQLGEGIEATSRLRTRAFFTMARTLGNAPEGQVPVIVANPRPWPLHTLIACELSLPTMSWGRNFHDITVTRNGRPVPSQVVKEDGNVNIEWRKRVVFPVDLPPFGIQRYDCKDRPVKGSAPAPRPLPKIFRFTNRCFSASINPRTGRMQTLSAHGRRIFQDAFRILVIRDSDDPWGTGQNHIREQRGAFKLVSARQARQIQANRPQAAAPLALVDAGPVQTTVQALFTYGRSHAVIRYTFPRFEPWFDMEIRLNNQEPGIMLKLGMPLAFRAKVAQSQSMAGREAHPLDGSETCMQQWVVPVPLNPAQPTAAILNDGTYAFDAMPGELRVNLLRSPAYTFLPVRQDDAPDPGYFHPRSDLGERHFRFRVLIGTTRTILEQVDRQAAQFNESAVALSSFGPDAPPAGPAIVPVVRVDDPAVLVPAIKKATGNHALIVRLIEPTGKTRHVRLWIRGRSAGTITLSPFEIKTLKVGKPGTKPVETGLLEYGPSKSR